MRSSKATLAAILALGAMLSTGPGCKETTEETASKPAPPPASRTDAPRATANPPAANPGPTQQAPIGGLQRRPLTLPCSPPMKIGTGDLDRSGKPEIVVACDDAILMLDSAGTIRARAPARGWPQVLLVADLDLDGRADVVSGWGTSRRRLDAKAVLLRHTLKGKQLRGTTLLEPVTTRNEIADLALEHAGRRWSLLVAHFTSKYIVRHVRLKASSGGIQRHEIGTWRMAMSIAPSKILGRSHLLVGRLYGDALGQNGDAFLLVKGKKLPIPTTRGVRAVASADLNRDGTEEILIADGWAQRYAREGRALLTRATWDGKVFRTRPLLRIPGEYTINKVVVADVDHDGQPEILVVGSTTTRLYRRAKDGRSWIGHLIAPQAGDAAAADLDGDGLDEILVAGQKAAIIGIKGLLSGR